MPNTGHRTAKRAGATQSSPPGLSPLARAASDAYERLALAVGANLVLVLGGAAGVLPAWLLAGRSPDWVPSVATLAHLTLVCPVLWLGLASIAIGVARAKPVGFRSALSAAWSRYAFGVLHMLAGVVAVSLLSLTVSFWSSAPFTGSPLERAVAGVWCVVGALGFVAWVHGWSLIVLRAAGAGALYRAVRTMVDDPCGSRILAGQALLVLGVVSLPVWLRWQGVAATLAVMLLLFFAFFWLALVSAHVALAEEIASRRG